MTLKGILAISLYILVLLSIVFSSVIKVGTVTGALLGVTLGAILSIGAILFKPFRDWLENFTDENIHLQVKPVSDENRKIVIDIYAQILERFPDKSGIQNYGWRLQKGEFSTRDIVREIGKSKEYFSKFVKHPNTPHEAVVYFYKHFLGREPETENVIDEYVSLMNKNGKDGWKLVVDKLIDSVEYLSNFGEDYVPK
jgi:hypothetical protein